MADNQKNELNEQQILSFLQDIVGKIRTEEDPFELNKYRRLFRKAVPFTLRAYFAAYLLKQIDSGNPVTKLGTSPRNDRSLKNGRMDRSRSGRNESRNENRKGSVEPKNDAVSGRRGQTNGEIAGTDRRQDDGRRNDRKRGENRSDNRVDSRHESRSEARDAARNEPRVSLPEDLSTTLFFSIGRNRRVYPRDIISLIMQNTGIEREHIGEIRVLDNYSFVQVLTIDAEKVIETMNEVEYRNRKISVSYSRKREEPSTVHDDEFTDESSSRSGSEDVQDSAPDSTSESPAESTSESESDTASESASDTASESESVDARDEGAFSDEGNTDIPENKEE